MMLLLDVLMTDVASMGKSSSCSCSWLGLQRMFVEPRLKRRSMGGLGRWVGFWQRPFAGLFQAQLPARCLCASTVELETGLQPLGDATSAQLGHVDFCKICMDLLQFDEFMWQNSIECKSRWRLWTSLLGLLGLLGLLASKITKHGPKDLKKRCFDVFCVPSFFDSLSLCISLPSEGKALFWPLFFLALNTPWRWSSSTLVAGSEGQNIPHCGAVMRTDSIDFAVELISFVAPPWGWTTD